MSAVLTLSALAMSLIVTEAKLRSAKRSSEAARNLSRALSSSRPDPARVPLRTDLARRVLRSISLFNWWVIPLFSDFVHRFGARIDLKSGCERDAIHLTRTCISEAVKATLFCY